MNVSLFVLPHAVVTGIGLVTLSGIPQEKLNELEYANGAVYANVYQTNTILRIDPKSGKVTGIINVPELLAPDAARRADVLNGIAYDRKTGHFYITGKLWPAIMLRPTSAAP